jgi:glycosidase
MAGDHIPNWLAGAILYQIYPQSFADSNGDGIGDLRGIEERLDYLSWLGVDTVWLNPCFASPMGDAGYDVADYMTIDPRYGTVADLVGLVESAGKRGIRVLLDLVAAHTSDQHAWFVASANDSEDHRYIWADRQVAESGGANLTGFQPSPGRRPGFYMPNFYAFQPALNFGYARPSADEPWRQPVDAPWPRENRQALREIMSHWLGVGVAGFRVDMASSLVKDDDGQAETAKLWRELRDWLDRTHPQAALFSEWGNPEIAVPGGFHVDFFLHFAGRAFRSLWHNGTFVNEAWEAEPAFFDASATGTPQHFLTEWAAADAAIGPHGFVSLPTSNHDFPRLVTGPRTAAQLPCAFAFLLTWPTLPAIYYGDEIGMRFVPDLPNVEGSQIWPGYNRAGSRTPMQWDAADPAVTYLPPDPAEDRPDVAAQRADPGSLLHLVRNLIALRKANPELGTGHDVEVLTAGYPFVYRRGGGRFLVAVNPGAAPAAAVAPPPGEQLIGQGVRYAGDRLELDGFAYAIFRTDTTAGA